MTNYVCITSKCWNIKMLCGLILTRWLSHWQVWIEASSRREMLTAIPNDRFLRNRNFIYSPIIFFLESWWEKIGKRKFFVHSSSFTTQTIVFSLLVSDHEILNKQKWANNIVTQSIPSYWLQHCNEYTCTVDIKLIPFVICLIHKPPTYSSSFILFKRC